MIDKPKTGTKQWSDVSFNIGIGCAHLCRYGYCRELAVRHGWVSSVQDFSQERLKKKQPEVRKFKGTVMFPTCHDITPFYLPRAREVLVKMAECGNDILIVTKPHRLCVSTLLNDLKAWKDQVEFRFTIGTLKPATATFWEPGAPLPEERLDCLIIAFDAGFKTSISMEPFLDPITEVIHNVGIFSPYVRGQIWIGKMNRVLTRVKPGTPEEKQMCQRILDNQCDYEILKLWDALKNHTKIAWKDSIQEVLSKFQITTN